MDEGARRMRDTTREQALRQLASVRVGRVGFTSRALPALRPVSHLVDRGNVIIRSHEGWEIVNAASTERGAVVAYEADDLDVTSRTGWSVLVVGLARLIEDPQEADRYRRDLPPLVAGDGGSVIRIYPELVSGFELVGSDQHASYQPMAGSGPPA
jgi:nitroimidazol reductase NimA-like FMN-containing flavoprotein (pyridoxamine 5'-phosphate oxidase superfamily)